MAQATQMTRRSQELLTQYINDGMTQPAVELLRGALDAIDFLRQQPSYNGVRQEVWRDAQNAIHTVLDAVRQPAEFGSTQRVYVDDYIVTQDVKTGRVISKSMRLFGALDAIDFLRHAPSPLDEVRQEVWDDASSKVGGLIDAMCNRHASFPLFRKPDAKR